MATTNALEAPNGGLLDWMRAISRPSLLAFGVGALAVLSGIITYAMVTGLVPYRPTPASLVTLLLINLTLGVTLGGLIVWRLIRLWSARRSGLAGARLHVRLVAMFSLIAVVPAILVALFAAVTLNLGIEAWFSARVKTALGNAVNVAQHYVQEHERGITLDAGEIAEGLEHDPTLFDAQNHVRIGPMFEKLAIMTKDRGLQASFMIDSHGNVLGSSKLQSMPDPIPPKASDIKQASQGAIVVDGDYETGQVRALIHMQALNDAYLLVVRVVDPAVLNYYRRTREAVSEYNRLDQNRSEVQLIFAMLYVVVSLVILLAAIWLGLWAANRLVRPISSLISAAERVSEGDLKAQVEVERDDDEVGLLGRAFNRMTGQLDQQRSALVSANRQNDERRRFTEAVLAGVSAGVIGMDHDGLITIVNRAAARLLKAAPEVIEGRHYSEAVPELAALIRVAISEPVGRASGEVGVKRGTTSRSLSVQVSSERGADGSGYVATFDDITDLVSAQRTAAWADIARRIAHEIKNPLTPIQLSAERLKRKYAGEISTDPEVFAQCTDTIIRQVGDIGRMVDEFSSFARMPTPVMRRENAQELIQQAVFLQRVAHPQIAFESRVAKEPVYLECDGRLVAQALTNVLKNAGESVSARLAKGDATPGRITISLESSDSAVIFRICDNGVGLPHEHRDRLTEPYVTTRAKGTGLGLAIVRKVMEDHGGEIALQDAGENLPGAEVVLTFPLRQKNVKEKDPVMSKHGLQIASEILIVDDEEDIRDLIAGILRDEGFETRVAADSDGALTAVRQRRPQLVVLDIWLQGSKLDGIQVLDTLKREQPDLPVVMISGHGSIETAVASIKKGAYDFIEKPFKADRLIHVVGRALEASRLRREVQELKLRAGDDAEMIGSSSCVSQLRQAIDKIAPTNSRVFVSGPSGSGKEVAARLIHARSRRAGNAFVAINCATMAPARIESELFGIEDPAGANKTGLFELAHNGTLYLDEVADMPLETQGKILRVLVEQTFTRVGGTTRVQVDARVICSTTRDLRAEIAAGTFREDLYHRLNVVPVRVPSLAERRDDIPLLVSHFMTRLSATSGLAVREVGDDAMAVLQAHSWPGNVRQLRNIVERLLILASDDAAQAISADLIPSDLGSNSPWGGSGRGDLVISMPLREAREIFERDYLVAQINRFGGNISRTAAFIGMERSALHRKLKSLGVGPTGREQGFNA